MTGNMTPSLTCHQLYYLCIKHLLFLPWPILLLLVTEPVFSRTALTLLYTTLVELSTVWFCSFGSYPAMKALSPVHKWLVLAESIGIAIFGVFSVTYKFWNSHWEILNTEDHVCLKLLGTTVWKGSVWERIQEKRTVDLRGLESWLTLFDP